MTLIRNVDATIQDSTSPLYIVPFSNVIASTTLAIGTALDDYTVNVVSATGIVVGHLLTIYNVTDNRVFFARVLTINTLQLVLDRPLDHTFPIGSDVTTGSVELAVDGSVTPQIFGVRNPGITDVPLEIDISRIMIACLTATTPTLSDFGDITNGLTRGIQLRRVDGTNQNIFNAKSNMELKNIMFDLEIQTAANQAQDGFTGRFTITRLGQVVRIGAGEDLQIIIQDDLTSLDSFTIIAEGSEVVD